MTSYKIDIDTEKVSTDIEINMMQLICEMLDIDIEDIWKAKIQIDIVPKRKTK